MYAIPDPIRAGLSPGWKVRGWPCGASPVAITCDVAIAPRLAPPKETNQLLPTGAINSPALPIRTLGLAPHRLLGTGTVVHPAVLSAATFLRRVEGRSG